MFIFRTGGRALGRFSCVLFVSVFALLGVASPSEAVAASLSSAETNFIATTTSSRQVVVGGGFVYWTNTWGGTIGRARIDGSDVNNSFLVGLSLPSGIALDENFIYWGASSNNSIGRASSDGSNTNENFITGADQPIGVAVDSTYIYWTNFGGNTIGRARIGGTSPNQRFISGANGPYDIAVNSMNIYWSNYNEDLGTSVGRANLDGSSPNQRFLTASAPTGLAIDGQYLYWSNYTQNTIGRATLDCRTIDQSFVRGLDHPTGLAVDGTYLYSTSVVAANTVAASVARAPLEDAASTVSNPAATVPSANTDNVTTSFSGRSLTTGPEHAASSAAGLCSADSVSPGSEVALSLRNSKLRVQPKCRRNSPCVVRRSANKKVAPAK